jgi:hypothetical protein
MSDFATFTNLADEAVARAAADKALDTRVAALETAPAGGVNFSFVDHEVVTLDANNEYLLAAAPAGIVAGSIPLVVVDGVVQDGVTADKTFEVLNDAGGIKRKLCMYPTPRSYSVLGDAKLALPAGQATTALLLDGSGDYVLSATDPSHALGTGDFTLEARIYPTTVANYNTILSSRPDSRSDPSMYGFGLRANGEVFFYTNGWILVSPSNTILANNWYHLALTRSGTTLTLWVNGTSVATATNNQNFTETRLYLGAHANGAEAYAGYIRDVRVTKGVSRYSATFTPPASPLAIPGDTHGGSVALLSTFAGTDGSTTLTYVKGIGGPLASGSKAFVSYRANNA